MSRGMQKQVSYTEAARALQESLDLLDPKAHNNIRNLTIGMIGILQAVDRLQVDVGLLHQKLQPILKSLEEENADWRNRYPKYDE